MRRFLVGLLEVFEVALVALGAVFLIRTFLIQPFLVSGTSMVPSFEDGDYLLIDELTYHFREPGRGEVVVFRYPRDDSKFFIKRIVGVPGDKVTIQDGKVSIYNKEYPEGKVLDESYLKNGTITSTHTRGESEFLLEPEQYLVLGDNRSASFDSRDWGLLDKREITGLVRLRLWPVNDLTVFAAPQY